MTNYELQGLKITYRVLKDVFFNLKQGETLALMGGNGAGKSTLAKILAGLIEPDSGEINLVDDGKPIPWMKVKRWQEIGLIGQHPRRQTIGATVGEELGFGLLNLGYEVKEARRLVRELAGKIGLGEQLNQSPSTLSGGERQRLVIASILALKPSFLILDESLTMLDERSQARCLELIDERSAEMGQLWITHDPLIASRAERLLVLHGGKLLDIGEPYKALRDAALCQEYRIRPLHSVSTGRYQGFPVGLNSKKTNPDPARENKNSPDREEAILAWAGARYGNRLEIDQKIGFGELIGVLGPSGAGKSTILESAIALLKPDRGAFLAFGQEVTKGRVHLLRQRVRLVLQEPGEYLIGRNVYDEVFYLQNRQERKEKHQDNLSYLQGFGISEVISSLAPENLSGGERQKVALAAALESLPEVLLLDEPLLGLDAESRRLMQGIVQELKGRLVILYVTHDLSELTDLADRLWLIEAGKLVLDCPGKEWVSYQERFREAGVRCPEG